MEATALSLAKLTLETVLPVAKQAIANDALLLLGVRQEVSFIANELEMMQAFLRAADTSDRARNEVVKIWVQQVRDLAYDVEDCLQEYLALVLPAAGTGTGCSPWICCLWFAVGGLDNNRHRIAAWIREIKAGVEEVSKRNLRYSIVLQPGRVVDPVASKEHAISISPTFADDVAAEECSLVGRAAQRAELVGRLAAGSGSGDAPLQVLAVWGMGGMGKTVLVRDVLRSSEVAEAFQCRAWVTVPRPFTMAEFLHALVTQLDMEAAGGASAASVKRVQTRAEYSVAMRRVARHLEDKRYIVAIDDVASIAAEWESIKKVLPDRNTGSWVVVTTRHEDIAMHCSTTLPSQPYRLNYLSTADSLQLLSMKAQIKHPLSKDLMDEANLILQRCCGLPLAVAAIGGLLATKPKTPMEWRKLHDHLGSELKANPGLEETKNVLASSYNALPYHLKSCFLYLSVFPRHREILQTRMVWRWMAEGLIVRTRDMIPEDVGELYFNQLISRSMIQPVTNWVNLNNRIKTCQVHDLMREIIMADSIEENHLFVLNEQQPSSSSPAWTLPSDKVRHLVVITTSAGGGRHDRERQAGTSALESINLSHVRSITVVGERVPSLSILSKMRMLRVLDLEDCPNAKDTDLKGVGELRHLRYLGLRRTNIAKLPESLGRLKFLQTLDLRGTKVTVLPRGITNLDKLRHLLAGSDMSNYGHTSTAVRRPGRGIGSTTNSSSSSSSALLDPCNGVRLPQGIEKLRNLHECGRINVGHGGQRTLHDIGKMAGLHYLGVTDLTERDGPELCDTVHKLHGLGDLEVRSRAHGSLHFLELISSPPPHLIILRLFGRLGRLPAWVASLRDVTKIKLLATELEQDAVEMLGELPSLVALHLWRRSYVGHELHLRAGKFRRLKLLALDSLDDLESLVIERTAMPHLEWLWLYRCVALRDHEDGITGILCLDKLKEIRLRIGHDKGQLEAALRRQVREHHNRPHFIL